MRVGIDATSWSNPRGYGRFTRELLGAVLAADPSHDLTFFIDEASYDVATMPDANWQVVPTSVAPTSAAVAGGRRSVADLVRMSRAVARHELDAIFFPTVYTWFPTLNRATVVLGVHDVIAEDYPSVIFPDFRSRAMWRAKGWLAHRRADWIMTVSEYSKRGIMRHFGHAVDRIAVVPEAPSPEFRPTDRDSIDWESLERWGISRESRALVYVGGMNPHKNLVRLVRAFARLRARANGPDRLILVGDAEGDRFTPGLGDLRDAITRSDVEDVVHFTGFVADRDLAPLLSASRALVLPSLAEGYGLPAVEAAACGTPVIATKNSPLPEILEGGGIFVDPLDDDGIEEAIMRMMDDGERSRAASIALERASALSWSRAAEVLIDLFDRVEGWRKESGAR